MDNERLGLVLEDVSDALEGSDGKWRFTIKETVFLCLTDEGHNRMRIISPIMEVEQLTEELMLNSLVANFHTALDVKYAVSDEVLWAVFIHPLKELSEQQLRDAISQVYYANLTFGTTFSSTDLVFPGNTKKVEREPGNTKKKI